LFRYLYGPSAATTSSQHDDGQCLPPVGDGTAGVNNDDDDEEELSIVDVALRENCGCVDVWMRDGVYFDPVATSYAALLVALGFMIVHRLSPVVRLAFSSLWTKCGRCTASTLQRSLGLYHHLPSSVQRAVVKALRKEFPEMPDIGSRPKKKSGGDAGAKHADEIQREWSAAAKKCQKLLAEGLAEEGAEKPRSAAAWKACWVKESRALAKLVLPFGEEENEEAQVPRESITSVDADGDGGAEEVGLGESSSEIEKQMSDVASPE
jgi:hypothetical protein